MSLADWKSDYSVNISSIDQQHKELLALLNQMYDGLTTQTESGMLKTVLSDLLQHTDNHFKTEERLMLKYRYAGYEAHKMEHQKLIIRVQDLQKEVVVGKATASVEVLKSFADWLDHHILSEDKQYARHLAQNGVH